MISDTTTFFLSFAGLFIGIGVYLWMLDGRTRVLEDRVSGLEADASAAKDKNDSAEDKPGHGS